MIRHIKDPEFDDKSLEMLQVLSLEDTHVSGRFVKVLFTPTIPHCSMAALIGLCIKTQLRRNLPREYRIDIFVSPGAHVSESEINKQINDKERVAASRENKMLCDTIETCIAGVVQNNVNNPFNIMFRSS